MSTIDLTEPPKPKRRERRLESNRAFAERHGVSTRTIDRWVKAGVLPRPTAVINGRKYWAPHITPKLDADAA
jgi:hypothetical protein